MTRTRALCIGIGAACLATALCACIANIRATPRLSADFVRVKKSEQRLYLLRDGKAFASFHVVFGPHPDGPKTRQGDGRTPEGRYVLDTRNAHSAYHRALHVSYPNAADRARAARLGVAPGGDIMVHGQPNGWGAYAAATQRTNWTLGCIALSDEDMDVVWDSVPNGTPIEIEP